MEGMENRDYPAIIAKRSEEPKTIFREPDGDEMVTGIIYYFHNNRKAKMLTRGFSVCAAHIARLPRLPQHSAIHRSRIEESQFFHRQYPISQDLRHAPRFRKQGWIFSEI